MNKKVSIVGVRDYFDWAEIDLRIDGDRKVHTLHIALRVEMDYNHVKLEDLGFNLKAGDGNIGLEFNIDIKDNIILR